LAKKRKEGRVYSRGVEGGRIRPKTLAIFRTLSTHLLKMRHHATGKNHSHRHSTSSARKCSHWTARTWATRSTSFRIL